MRRGPGTLLKTKNDEIVRELEKNSALLIYDLPYPPSNKPRKNITPWYSWYDWASSNLRSCGYPIQYSVVLIDVSKIPEVQKLIERIDEKRLSINKTFQLNIPPANIYVIKFQVEDKESARALLDLIKLVLRESMETFIEDLQEQLRNGKDKTRLQKRVREYITRLRRQDYLNLLLRDPELRKLVLQLEILVA